MGQGGKSARREVSCQQVSFRLEPEAAPRHVLVAPAIMGPQPRRAEIIVGAKQGLEPAVETNRHGLAAAIMHDRLDAHLQAPEAEAARKDAIDPRVEFLGHQARQFG